jgi:hypothetical protein
MKCNGLASWIQKLPECSSLCGIPEYAVYGHLGIWSWNKDLSSRNGIMTMPFVMYQTPKLFL